MAISGQELKSQHQGWGLSWSQDPFSERTQQNVLEESVTMRWHDTSFGSFCIRQFHDFATCIVDLRVNFDIRIFGITWAVLEVLPHGGNPAFDS